MERTCSSDCPDRPLKRKRTYGRQMTLISRMKVGHEGRWPTLMNLKRAKPMAVVPMIRKIATDRHKLERRRSTQLGMRYDAYQE